MRNKVYYPSSQVTTGLYTTGSEWALLDTGEEYIGFYHRYTDGSVLTGPEYNKFNSKRLITFVDSKTSPNVAVYRKTLLDLRKTTIVNTPLELRTQGPIYMYPAPTMKDYEKGKFVRYFLKRRNENFPTDIFEVDKAQYLSWQKVKIGIDEKLYMGLKMDWKLTGPLNDKRTSPHNIEYGVEDTNKRMVFLKDREFKGLMNFLTNYIEWSIHSPLVSEDIKRMFGTSS